MSAISPELLSQLIRTHGAALVLYSRQWCASPDDIVQDSFMQLVRQATLPDNPAAWLFRVVRNRSINVTRSQKRRGHHEALVAARSEPWFEESPDELIDAELATGALEELPLELRETIVARLWGGLTYDEIADLTGTSTATAYRRYLNGLAQLRERLGVACQAKKIHNP